VNQIPGIMRDVTFVGYTEHDGFLQEEKCGTRGIVDLVTLDVATVDRRCDLNVVPLTMIAVQRKGGYRIEELLHAQVSEGRTGSHNPVEPVTPFESNDSACFYCR